MFLPAFSFTKWSTNQILTEGPHLCHTRISRSHDFCVCFDFSGLFFHFLFGMTQYLIIITRKTKCDSLPPFSYLPVRNHWMMGNSSQYQYSWSRWRLHTSHFCHWNEFFPRNRNRFLNKYWHFHVIGNLPRVFRFITWLLTACDALPILPAFAYLDLKTKNCRF